MRTKKFDTGFASLGSGIPPLDDLVTGGHAHNEEQTEKGGQDRAAPTLARDPFGQGKGVEADGEMTDAVEVITLGSDQVGDPIERDVGKGVVAADRMPEEPEGHQTVGQGAEPKPLVGDHQQAEDDDDRDDFGNPDLARDRFDSEQDEEHC